MTRGRGLILIAVIFFLSNCGTYNPWYSKREKNWEASTLPNEEDLLHTVYLIGDAGQPDKDKQEPSLRLLESYLKDGDSTENANKTVVFLGDNIYRYGLPEEDDNDRAEAERRINAQLDIVKGHPGKKIFIPGNHDWDHSGSKGYKRIIAQQNYVENYLESQQVYYPGGGCPGPSEINLNDQTVLIVIDSEWWLHKYYRPYGNSSPCDATDEVDFLIQLEDVVDKNKDKHIVIALHHPLRSNGNHGGHYSITDYLFPITLKYPNWYVPLPIIGAIYPIARQYGYSRQDIPNAKYQKLIKGILNIIRDKKNVTIAAGHEHNLQFHQIGENNHIVSGSGCKQKHVVKRNGASFVVQQKGFARINYYKNGEAWVEFILPEEDGAVGKVVFRRPLGAIDNRDKVVTTFEEENYQDSVKTVVPGKDYATNSFLKKLFLGKHYRQVWSTPVQVKYLDLDREYGGIKPLKKGGGQQTYSLRCEGGDGFQCTLRSIDKDPAAALPEGLRRTLAADIVQDQISTSHPYGALTIPRLADAVGVYHTNPKLRYIPYSPRLGSHLDEFGGMLILMEIRPDEDLSQFANFGNSENVVGTDRMWEQVIEDNDNEVDQDYFLKARLLDMFIGDWDRHSDQWRWAEFDKEGKGEIYKAIPRDRDNVYVKYDGILPAFAASIWGQRKLTNFGYHFTDVVGLNINGAQMDYPFLNDLDRRDWQLAIDTFKRKMTDEVIDSAINDLPVEVQNIQSDEIKAKLKSRRDEMDKLIPKYYEKLAKEVDIPTSDKHEFVFINRINNDSTLVQIYKRKKDGEIKQKLYDRVFLTNETKEIRVYTLGGEDSVVISGKVNRGIKLRILTGDDNDIVIDNSEVTGLKRKTKIYDDRDINNQFIPSSETKIIRTNGSWVKGYDRLGYKADENIPILFVEYDIDNGIYLGAGFKSVNYGFAKSPFIYNQTIRGDYSFRTQAFNIMYKGNWPMLFNRNTGFTFSGQWFNSRSFINYFGQGNSTDFTFDHTFYRIRFNGFNFKSSVDFGKSRRAQLKVGPVFEATQIDSNQNTFINEPDVDVNNLQDNYVFLPGLDVRAIFDLTDNIQAPTTGFYFTTGIKYYKSFSENSYEFTNLNAETKFYVTPNTAPRLTIAARLGGEKNIGSYPFFKSSFIGGRTNLRGFRRTRFAGHSSAYQSLELRFKMTNINNYLITGNFGPLAFVDNARVWSDVPEADIWHTGVGGGLWLNLYNLFTVSGSVSFSKEGPYFLVNSGFFF